MASRTLYVQIKFWWRSLSVGSPGVNFTSGFAARCQTNSAPCMAASTPEGFSRSPSMKRKFLWLSNPDKCSILPLERLSIPVTESPRAMSASARSEPMHPATPVTKFLIGNGSIARIAESTQLRDLGATQAGELYQGEGCAPQHFLNFLPLPHGQ